MTEFQGERDMVTRDISSMFSKEMSCKSEVVSTSSHILYFDIYHWVPLGVILKNETKLNDMADIIEDLSRYVPVHESTVSVNKLL